MTRSILWTKCASGIFVAHPNEFKSVNGDLQCIVKVGPGIKNKSASLPVAARAIFRFFGIG